MAATADKITQVCNDVRDMLLAKNVAYGDSVSNPLRVFSKADKLEAIRVRIDDKLSRISRGGEYPGDNDVRDLVGYLLLYLANDGTAEAPVDEGPQWTLRWDRSGDLWGELDGKFWLWSDVESMRSFAQEVNGYSGWHDVQCCWGPLEDVEAG